MPSGGVFHNSADMHVVTNGATAAAATPAFSYDFQNFWHPFVGALIQQLNQDSVAGMLNPAFLGGPTCALDYSSAGLYTPGPSTTIEPGIIDTSLNGPYANYNWELLYHIPVMIAVHLSNNQYFAEAQKWFHLVFDPTTTDTSAPIPDRYWRSFVFNTHYNPDASNNITNINTLLTLLSSTNLTSSQQSAVNNLITGYNAIMAEPFNPHVVARTRPSAYQWYVVMKYLDNLIAWGDSLFLQDTVDTLNEATLQYVLAHKLLGPAPQSMPQPATGSARNFLQLKQAGFDRMGNAMIDLESQFPFNAAPGPDTGSSPGTGAGGASGDQSGVLFGIGRSLYFCIPPNQKLLGYWDTVADRLFKIRNSENFQGVPQQLPLYGTPLDPGVLVAAAAAGIDISSVVSGLNQPTSPVRSPLLIQKALEIASEVRSLGAALLAAYEKGDAEKLALLRQAHEIKLQQMTQNVRFLQWQHARETTQGLLASRSTTYERYAYYLRMLNLTPDSDAAPPIFGANETELTEDNWQSTYTTLVGQYDLTISELAYNSLQYAQGTSPANTAGATGTGQMYLNDREDAELNTLLPVARDARLAANVFNAVAAAITPIPKIDGKLHFWGIGLSVEAFNGEVWGAVARLAADISNTVAAWETDQATMASKTASYQRRADEWTYQANLAAKDLMATGRQIIASLIAEQITNHEYTTVETQVAQAQCVQQFLKNKFTNADFYAWMQNDLSGLYYQYYRFACDTARQAEATMKNELMRPELDASTFIQYNYWDAGHAGLLSGEALYLDIKRMEMAYHASNLRELELTRHVSLRRLDPGALINLRITGQCTVTVPEWLYDWDSPGLYMRRVKTVAVSMPAVTSGYTSVNCTLSQVNSSLRTSPLLANGAYARSTNQDDDRFTDYVGSTDQVVTSSATNDSGMFETNLNDQRFLPFEGSGAISTWNLSLPTPLRSFDYSTIADVILHIRYTARQGGTQLAEQATKELTENLAPPTSNEPGSAISLALLFCLRYDFPTEWAAFVNTNTNTSDNASASFSATLSLQMFPYAVQYAAQLGGKPQLQIDAVTLYAAGAGPNGDTVVPENPLSATQMQELTAGLNGSTAQAPLTLPSDQKVMIQNQNQQVYLLLQYSFVTKHP